MVKSVARRLGLPRSRYDELVALYSGAEIARGHGTAYTASHSPPTDEEIAARRGLQEDIRRNRGISEARRKRVQADMRDTSRRLEALLQDEDDSEPAGTYASVSSARRAPASESATAVVIAERPPPIETRDYSQVPPQAERPTFVTNPTPPPGEAPPVTASALSWESLAGWLDFSKGYDVAKEAFTGTLNWARSMGSMCYKFVKKALIDAGVIDAPDPSSTAVFGLRPASAKMLNEDIRRNPELLRKMGYRRADLSTLPDDASKIPDGALLGYDAGCSFADPSHGHAEIVVGEATYDAMRTENKRLARINAAPNETRVCHFACTTRTTPFLRTYGTDRTRSYRDKQGKTRQRVVPACLNMYVPVKAV